MIYPFGRKENIDIWKRVMWRKLSGYDLIRWSYVLFETGLVEIKLRESMEKR